MSLGEWIPGGNATGYYKLNGDANDSSGNGRNGTATNVTWTNGRIGSGAGSFNGSSSRIATTLSAIPTNTNTLTISCWFKYNSGTNYFLFGEQDIAIAPGGLTLDWNIYNANKFSFAKGTGGTSGSAVTLTTTNTIAMDTNWHRITVVQSTSGMAIYYDGALVGSNSSTSNVVCSTTRILQIGARNDAGTYNYFFNGLIDDFMVLNRALTASEERKQYTYGKGRFGII